MSRSGSPFGPAADGPGAFSPAMDDRLIAAVDLIQRTGGREFQVGYQNETAVTVEEAQWWAHVQYRGMRIIEENHTGPIVAAEALALRLLNGGRCKCGRVATSNPRGVQGGRKLMFDGQTWSHEAQVAAGVCVWKRHGKRWESGCDAPPIKVGKPK